MALDAPLGESFLVRISRVCAAIAASAMAAWSLAAGESALAAASSSPNDTAIVDLRGGGYSVVSLPPSPMALAEKRAPAGAGPAQSLRLAVALVNFRDAPVEPFSTTDVTATLFAPTGSVAELYADQSFGLVRLTGDTFGWLTVPRGGTPCDFSAWAESAAAGIGKDVLSSYTNLLVVFPTTSACAWTGLAYVGGTTAWINGEPSARAAGHELGHNLGLGHASSLHCSGPRGRVSLSASCDKADEYGDPFTLMGSGGTLHVNGIHKLQLGWLPAKNVLDVTRTGTYDIAPLGVPTALPQVLRIPREDSALVVEYRQPAAAFERFGGPLEPAGGVTARVATGSGSALQSLLVDAEPSTASYADAVLVPGRELVDLATGIRVTTRATASDRAVVDVFVPGTVASDGMTERPEALTMLTAVATPGTKRTRVDLRWLPADSARNVSRYLLLRNGRVVARTEIPAATRFEAHGRSVYSVVSVGPGGIRSHKSPRLVVSTARPRSSDRAHSPIRGVTARPTRDGRLALGLRRSRLVPVLASSKRSASQIPVGGSLAHGLDPGRTRFLLRPVDRPSVRPVQVIAVRRPPLPG